MINIKKGIYICMYLCLYMMFIHVYEFVYMCMYGERWKKNDRGRESDKGRSYILVYNDALVQGTELFYHLHLAHSHIYILIYQLIRVRPFLNRLMETYGEDRLPVWIRMVSYFVNDNVRMGKQRMHICWVSEWGR